MNQNSSSISSLLLLTALGMSFLKTAASVTTRKNIITQVYNMTDRFVVIETKGKNTNIKCVLFLNVNRKIYTT